MVSGGMICIKYLLFVFNLVFAVSMWTYIFLCRIKRKIKAIWCELCKDVDWIQTLTWYFLFQISGIAILAIGAIIQNFYSNYTDFLHGKFFVGPVLLIVVGVIVFVVAFFGCCGAVKENHCMIMTVSLWGLLP